MKLKVRLQRPGHPDIDLLVAVNVIRTLVPGLPAGAVPGRGGRG
jgi:hypothetical protein